MRIEKSLSREYEPRLFGRKGVAVTMTAEPRSAVIDDLKLFGLTFAFGFLFVSLYLA